MYCFQNAGVRYDGRTKISVDARLTNIADVGLSIGATHVGHYSRDDYASLQGDERYSDTDLDEMADTIATNLVNMYQRKYQRTVSVEVVAESYDKGIFKATISSGGEVIREMYVSRQDYLTQKREPVYYRNIRAEGVPNPDINPGYRALYSLQLANNDEVVKGLLGDRIFSIGFGPQTAVEYENLQYTDDGIRYDAESPTANVDVYKPYNLGYDREAERELNKKIYGEDNDKVVYLLDPDDNTQSIIAPTPAVNPVMSKIGDAIPLTGDNSSYTNI